MPTAEQQRLSTDHLDWLLWGPYLSERAWGTVREDYSPDGEAWQFFPHDHARSRAYRWGEDGIAGLSDRHQLLCFALALWNGQDPILKERLYGLAGYEGNHGEDVKEYYWYLDSTPTHSYMKMLYKYPQVAFPYADLKAENGRRGFLDFEYELLDTGVFDEDAYFDVFVEYAKASETDILITITATNHGATAAPLWLLPTLWFRNTWSFGYPAGPMKNAPGKPNFSRVANGGILAEHPAEVFGNYHFYADEVSEWLFTENETNAERLFGIPSPTSYVKDAFHRYVIDGDQTAVNPAQTGTKVASMVRLEVGAGQSRQIRLRLSKASHSDPFADFETISQQRRIEADEFYAALHPAHLNADEKRVQRQAFAGMLWSKQLYYYDIEQWLKGDPAGPTPADSRYHGRNATWRHLNNFDIISMPDKWEYPWYAGWDLAFHCIALALVDVKFAKQQLILLTREWYMHPNGQLPAYEWSFDDVNPPVHAWATWRVFCMDRDNTGVGDTVFLKRVFNKLLLNFTWWVNRKDADGSNIFQGGFLGLDNISIFDRSAALPIGGTIDQSDGTSWMGFYSLSMMNIAIELAKIDPAYEDLAIKFFEHFLGIAVAMSGQLHNGVGLWDEQDGFFYDVLRLPDGNFVPLRVRSLVGLMPLIAVETIGHETLMRLPDFNRSIGWLCEHRENLVGNMTSVDVPGFGNSHIVSIPTEDRLRSVLHYMLDESEFLSPYGIRSVSKYHEDHPYSLTFGNESFGIDYQPAESKTGLFGGNSNWRGPVWFPINFLLIEALRRYHRYYEDDLKVECPTGSGVMMNLDQVADEIASRLTKLFLLNEDQQRPIYGGLEKFQSDPRWRDHILFHEYFHGDNGAGLGASHQTGWTGLVADLLQQSKR